MCGAYEPVGTDGDMLLYRRTDDGKLAKKYITAMGGEG